MSITKLARAFRQQINGQGMLTSAIQTLRSASSGSFLSSSGAPPLLAAFAPPPATFLGTQFVTRSLVTLRGTTSAPGANVWSLWRVAPSLRSAPASTGGVRWASGLVPRFVGGKMKPYSAFKSRFKMTGGGKIMYMRPGHVHKRHNKGRGQLLELSKVKVMHPTYEKTMKRLGFVSRRY